MLHSTFQGKQLPLLGFGTMRLPSAEGKIDKEATAAMVARAMENGVNYFDTAWPYHGGQSEVVIGELLKAYPRESFYLATKYPGHQITSSYDPAAIFEQQLKKCQVDYFDFYLLHNVHESSIPTYLDPRWGIIDYFKEQKRLGRIKHLGFSCHARLPYLEKFLDLCGDDMEFCQIQLNYLDWTLQDAKGKYELLTARDIPVWVMEPVRGGRLARLTPEEEAPLKALRPGESIPAWAFRFLQGLPNVKMILSGMSNMEQMEDNLKTFSSPAPLSSHETQLLLELAQKIGDAVPCTGCRYCCSGCPMGLDIPMLLATYNELKFFPNLNVALRLQVLPPEQLASACIACGKCAQSCPQNINVPEALKDLDVIFRKLPLWADICRQREEAAKKLKTQSP
ncbi:MAG: aldo/keto reductase [Oscillospiraceae bacterium]|nr:aldo/keto reductase [Oscillospiraceae bacterium]